MNKFKTIGRLLITVKRFSLIIVLAVINGVLGNLFAISISFLAAFNLVLLLKGQVNSLFFILIGVMIILGILRGVLRYFEQYSNHYIAFKILAHIRHIIFKKLAELSPSKIDSKDKGALLNQVTSDVETLEVFYAHTISPFFIALLVNGTIVIFVSVYYNWLLSIIFLLVYLFIGCLVPIKYYKFTHKEGREYRDKLALLSSYSLDTISGRKDVRLLNQKKNFLNRYINETKELVKNKKILNRKGTFIKSINDLFIYLGAIILILVGVFLFKVIKFDLYSLIIILVLFISSFGPIIALSNLPGNLNQTLASAKRLFELLDEKPLIKKVKNNDKTTFDELTISNLNFKYKEDEILKNVSFAVKSGEIVGISGDSGAGKSTILKLLMKYFPYNGSIKVGDKNLKEIDDNYFYENVCMFSQYTYLFNTSIKENMLIAKKDATEEEIIEALKKASIYDFVNSLENGINTVINENSQNISLGEKQRLGLARVFLRNPKILLLDEPTSNIDSFNEFIILNSIKKYGQSMGIILISHRESTLAIATKKYRLVNGVIYE